MSAVTAYFTPLMFEGELPECFTFPFCYQPHAITLMAAAHLQQSLLAQEEISVMLGLTPESEQRVGKMFGVLVVKTLSGQLGYLSAFSGQATWSNTSINFVCNVSDAQESDACFRDECARINRINEEVTALENSDVYLRSQQALSDAKQQFQRQVQQQQALMSGRKKQRNIQRQQAQLHDTAEAYQLLQQQLAQQSIALKKQLQQIKLHWQQKIACLTAEVDTFEYRLMKLKKQRSSRSKLLQKQIFSHYRFLNAEQEIKNLNEIFAAIPEQTPPAGAGDCAAPKLLQFAFQHQLQPVALGEFWWGAAPRSAIRQHKNFYPSCYSKCRPILGHMLQGLTVEANPLLNNPAQGKVLPIVYQDDDILVVNKPAEFLSVPGKHIEDSVYSRVKTMLPQATGPLIVHRLDMSTSGLLVLALNKRAHKALQQQFIHRQVEKRYSALVMGHVEQEEQIIELPLRLDLDDKPRQLVCFQHGKSALTYCKKVRLQGQHTLLHLFPKTGRTHQLRVHCAHHLGLNTPIVGDDHYGKKANRLHLHAEYLAFTHPITKQTVSFMVKADFDKQTD